MASEAINLGHVDEVWFVPCGKRTDKKLTLDGDHRLAMINLAIKEFFPPDFPIKVYSLFVFNSPFLSRQTILK